MAGKKQLKTIAQLERRIEMCRKSMDEFKEDWRKFNEAMHRKSGPARRRQKRARRTLKTSMLYKGKCLLANISLTSLGAACEAVSRSSPKLQAELAKWEEGRTVVLGVLGGGPAIALQCTGGRLRYLGRGDRPADLKVLFKNLDVALPVFLGLMPAYLASVQRRLVLHGSIQHGMQFDRALDIVLDHFLPGLLLKLNTRHYDRAKAVPLARKAAVLAGVSLRLPLNLGK